LKVNIWLLVGYSGSGKTTLAENVCSKLGIPMLSYSEMFDELAHQNGYSNRGNFYSATPLDEFKHLYDAYAIEKISNSAKARNSVLVEGLCSLNAYYGLCNSLSDCVIKIIYINVPKAERVRRIKIRDGRVWNGKELTKAAFGLDDLVKLADYIVDGSKAFSLALDNVINVILYNDMSASCFHLYN